MDVHRVDVGRLVAAAFLPARDLAAVFRLRVATAFLAPVDRLREVVVRFRVVRLPVPVVRLRAVVMATTGLRRARCSGSPGPTSTSCSPKRTGAWSTTIGFSTPSTGLPLGPGFDGRAPMI
jgi:hypothetical protein